MDLRRLRVGELIAACAAVGLLATLFLDWNRAQAGVEQGSEALGWLMLALLLVAIALALILAFVTVARRPAAIPIGAAVLTTAIGAVVALILAVRVLFLDDSLGAAYAGLVLAALIPAGGWIAVGDERTEAPYSAAPDVPVRPAPPAEA